MPGVQSSLTVHRHDLKLRKSDVPIGGVSSFEISFNGEKMLYRQGDRWTIAAPRPMSPGSGDGPPAPPSRCSRGGNGDNRSLEDRRA